MVQYSVPAVNQIFSKRKPSFSIKFYTDILFVCNKINIQNIYLVFELFVFKCYE